VTAFDWDALAAAGLRLLGDYCDGPHGGAPPMDGVFRVPGGSGWYCQRCFVSEWVAAARPELPTTGPGADGHRPGLPAPWLRGT